MAATKASTRDAEAALLASRALVAVAARSLAAIEDTVTLAQYRALVLLGSRGELNVGALADVLAVHQSTATRLCDRLEHKDLITRNTSPQSRREIILTITPAGLKLLRIVTDRRRAEINGILGRLSRDKRHELREAFELFGAAPRELPDDAWKLGWTT